MKKKIIGVLFVFLLTAGCARKTLMKTYYVLDLPQNRVEEIVPLEEPLDFRVDVRDFWVNRPYSQTNIASRGESHELQYFVYAFWAERPGFAIAELVYEVLIRKNLFKQCTLGHSAGPEWIIDGDIFVLERCSTEKGHEVHVKGEMHLKRGNDEAIAIAHPFDIRRPLEPDNSMNTFARMVSEIMGEQMKPFMELMMGALSPR